MQLLSWACPVDQCLTLQELLLEPAGLQDVYQASGTSERTRDPVALPTARRAAAVTLVVAAAWRMSQTQDRECHLDDYLLQNILSNLCGADVCRAQVCMAVTYPQYCARGYSGLACMIACFEC